jgi:hypothetical protein
MCCYGIIQLAGDRVEGFFPADPLPFTAAPVPFSFKRMQDSVRIIDVLNSRCALGTHRPFGNGLRIAFNTGYPSVFHGDENAANSMTTFTSGFNDPFNGISQIGPLIKFLL